MDVMMIWGGFAFEVPATAYNQLTISQQFRWSEHAPQGLPSVYHWGGIGEVQLTLECTLYTELGGTMDRMDALRDLAGQGIPHFLVDGSGWNWGRFVLKDLNTSYGEAMHPRGIPAKQNVQMTLLRHGG